MKGHNKIELNQSTMREVVQRWIDAKTQFGVEVTDVDTRSLNGSEVFVVTVKEREEQPANG